MSLDPEVHDHIVMHLALRVALERARSGCTCDATGELVRLDFDPVTGGSYNYELRHADDCAVTKRDAAQWN